MRPAKQPTGKRSPLKARPLRVPGQSIEEQIARLTTTKLVDLAFLPGFFSALALFEWWRWLRAAPPSPVLVTVIAAAAWAWFFYRLPRLRQLLHDLKQGRDGERAVAELLAELRAEGYRVLHDIVAEGFNIDHVLVGPAGVFSIETKTISKPAGADAQVTYDGESVFVAGRKPDRNPVAQATAQARWIGELIRDGTGRSVDVRPVVLYPGWFVSPQPKGCKVWVLNPKALPAFLKHEAGQFSEDEGRQFAACLKQYVRLRTPEAAA